MPEKLRFVVGEDETGSRLDVYLARVCADLSRTIWQKNITSGNVLVNNQVVNAVGQKLNLGDKITTTPVRPLEPSLIPASRPLDIIYEDKDVIVIDKPAGLVAHPVRANQPSVAGGLADKIEPDGSLRPGIVHRLDRDTSGVMILAKTKLAQEYLMKQFKSRLVEKKYQALVWGRPKLAEAKLDLPIARIRSGGVKCQILAHGRSAQTSYRVIAEYDRASLLEVTPQTGRTHQIRVHLAHIGTPVVGDVLYGKKSSPKLGRHFLHATSLGLTLPNGQKKIFTSKLAPELKDYLESL